MNLKYHKSGTFSFFHIEYYELFLASLQKGFKHNRMVEEVIYVRV